MRPVDLLTAMRGVLRLELNFALLDIATESPLGVAICRIPG
jgi:hypothetical protein